VLDIPLTFFTLLAIYAFYRRGRWFPLYYVGMGLAVLVKGPVGIALVLLATVRRGWAKHPLWGIPLMLAVIAAWLVPACIRGGPEYTDTILFRQTAGRMVQSWSHQRPFWYYVPHLIVGFFPWIFFVPRALARGWNEERRLFLWFVLGFVFFSLVSGKRERYLLPLYPALALLVGRYVAEPRRRLGIGPHVAMAVLGVGVVLLALVGAPVADRLADDKPYVADLFHTFQWSPILIVGGIVTWFIARRGRPSRDPWHVVAAVAAFWLVFDLGLAPRINDVKSARPVAEALAKEAEGARAGAYPRGFEGPYNLYSGLLHIETLETEADLEAFLKAPGRAVVLTSDGHVELIEKIDAPHHVREVKRVGSRVMVFVTNYEPSGS
jgi:4-amino-4-deoxy-L-arabinose transferase-like glycosyltransferase